MREHRRGDNLMLVWLITWMATYAWPYPEVEGLHVLVTLVAIVYWTCRGVAWLWRRIRREWRVWQLVKGYVEREGVDRD